MSRISNLLCKWGFHDWLYCEEEFAPIKKKLCRNCDAIEYPRREK